jgi:hypothetical protein
MASVVSRESLLPLFGSADRLPGSGDDGGVTSGAGGDVISDVKIAWVDGIVTTWEVSVDPVATGGLAGELGAPDVSASDGALLLSSCVANIRVSGSA